MTAVERLQSQFGLEQHVRFVLSEHNDKLVKAVLLSPNFQSKVELYLHGAHITSYTVKPYGEQLFLSERAKFDGKTPIRGGIPIIFPQFASTLASTYPSVPNHGFARAVPWTVSGSCKDESHVRLSLILRDSEESKLIWPHQYVVEYRINLFDKHLSLSLRVVNMDLVPFSFTCALHTYFKVQNEISTVRIGPNFFGLTYVDRTRDPNPRKETRSNVNIDGQEVDRYYTDAPRQISLLEGRKLTVIETTNTFPDVVIWNPWIEKTRKTNDMAPDDYLHFVCVEAANVAKPIVLQPVESFEALQTISVAFTATL